MIHFYQPGKNVVKTFNTTTKKLIICSVCICLLVVGIIGIASVVRAEYQGIYHQTPTHTVAPHMQKTGGSGPFPPDTAQPIGGSGPFPPDTAQPTSNIGSFVSDTTPNGPGPFPPDGSQM